jgi:hypothetical protein
MSVAKLVETDRGKDTHMVRFRGAIIAVILSAGLSGCSYSHWSIFHCDSCDDFPTPGYGPDNSMMPGSYTGAPAPGSSEAGVTAAPSASGSAPATAPPPGGPARAPAGPAGATPPAPPGPDA